MSSKEDGGIQPEEFVERICRDSPTPPDVQVLVGFLGRSPEQGYWRLYLTADLVEFLEFAEGDLVHHAKIDLSTSTLGGSVIWLRRDATVRHTRTVTRQSQLEFLVGKIVAGHLGGTVGAAVVGMAGGGRIKSIPPEATVCFSCPTQGGEHSCVPATCTLATSCLTRLPRCGGD